MKQQIPSVSAPASAPSVCPSVSAPVSFVPRFHRGISGVPGIPGAFGVLPLLALLLLLAACTAKPAPEAALAEVTDDYGRTSAVPVRPRRVVSTSPSVTEILFALGADSLLVGRTDFCQYPAEAAAIPSIGGISNLNVERILSLSPDLIISGSMVDRKVTDQITAMGVPMVFVIEKPHFDALYDNILAIGRLVGREREADSLNTLLRQRVSRELNPSASSTHDPEPSTQSAVPKCYYVVGFGPGGNFTAGGNTFIDDIIRLSGGRNIAHDVEGWSYSLEALVQQDPDYIIVRREDSAAFVGIRPYNTLRAVRTGHVVGIESATMDLQIPRNIDAVLYLRQRMGR